jgi:dTDP-4-amino-4,6-dideoxygalactose transaminase
VSIPSLDLGSSHEELGAELEDAMRRVLRSGHYLRGPEGERFESEFAEYCGVESAVGVANGLEAVQLTLEAMGIGRGDEVLVSSHTSIATWLAITHAGARPIPVEPAPDSMLIDPSRVEALLTRRTAAIVAVHLYGMPADMDALARIARQHGVGLVEDASQAHGARLGGRAVGSLGDAAAFSLYPTKNLGAAGDAGIAVSNDEALLERIRMLANYGERRRHHSEVRGYNSRLDELQAALLRVKLKHLDDWNARRRVRARQYLDELSGCDVIQLPAATEAALPVWHQFVVRVAERDSVREKMLGSGVQTLVHYPTPPHRTPAYASDYPEPLPITEQLADSVLSLPISPQLTESDCARVCDALRAATSRAPSAARQRR